MQFRLYVLNKRTKEYEVKGNYKTRQMAETKAEPYISKGRDARILPLPLDSLKIGMIVYQHDGELYGEIVDDSGSFWYIRREVKDEYDRAFFLKDSFVEKYENGVFIIKEELDDSK